MVPGRAYLVKTEPTSAAANGAVGLSSASLLCSNEVLVVGSERCSARMFLVSCPDKDVLNRAHHSAEYFGTIPPLTHLSVASLLWNLHGFAGTWNPSGDLTFFVTNAGCGLFFRRPRGNSPVVLSP